MGSLDNFHRTIVQRVHAGELLLGVRRSMWKGRTRRLAMSDPATFDRLWNEGALSLKLAIVSPSQAGSEICTSPDDDYRQFIAQHFLRMREYGNRVEKARVFS